MTKKIFLILLALFPVLLFSQQVIKRGNIYYLSNTLIIKYKNGISPSVNSINALFKKESSTNVANFKQLYPDGTLLKGEKILSNIYLVNYDSQDDPVTVARKISKAYEIEYAEPRYIHTLTDSPNDSLMVFQTNLAKISASKAWDITKGSASIIIGIVDTGVDWKHPDLAAHIVKGIDLGGLNGTPDDDPSEDAAPANFKIWQPYHGTHVAGIASAVTNNRTGVASIGYNCSLMPVKVSRSDVRDSDRGTPLVYYGFDGIKYAADHGAKIISCSWGGYAYSRYEQDVIDYVTAKGSLVVAAQGNDGKKTSFYPADYKNVLSVGWCDSDDKKNISANYGNDVDVMAPGTFILSTWPKEANNNNNDYNIISGSSMATPLVSGLAGLVAARFPNYTPRQIAEQIRVTADDIYSINNTTDLNYQLGKGRINAYRAVTETNSISVRATDVNFNNSSGIYLTGDEITATLTLTNYLKPVNGLNISVNSSDSFIQLTQTSLNNISLDSNQSSSNKAFFKFKIMPGAPLDYDVNFLLKYSAGTYSDFQWVSLRINPTYANHNSNKITMSVTSKGTLGFTDFPANIYGNGFHFSGGDNLLFEGALMYGVSPTALMDGARETTEQSKDFVMISPIKIVTDQSGNQVGTTIFNDSGAGTSSMGIEVNQKSYSFANSPDDKYIIIVDELKNKTAKDINNLYAGYYFDWDMPANDSGKDSTAYDTTENFGYAFYQNRTVLNTIVGAGVISSKNYGYYPINNAATYGDVRLFDSNGYSDAEKWITISSGIIKTDVGYVDISFVVSDGPINIPAGKSAKFAIAIAASDKLSDLRNIFKQSRIKYQNELATDINQEKNIPAKYFLSQNYPNPFNPSTLISYQLSANSHVTLKVYDLLGREVATLVDEFKQAGYYNSQFSTFNLPAGRQGYQLPSGIYFYRLTAGNFSETKKMMLVK